MEKVTGRDEKYMFRDATGTIVVDIDDKVFAGKDVTPATKVRLTGKVDTSKKKDNKVDVKLLEIL